jgi:hypothetical protein
MSSTTDSEQKLKETEELDDRKEKNQVLIQALHEWMDDESGYDEENWPKLKKALEENHDSNRKLFSE